MLELEITTEKSHIKIFYIIISDINVINKSCVYIIKYKPVLFPPELPPPEPIKEMIEYTDEHILPLEYSFNLKDRYVLYVIKNTNCQISC